MRATVERGMAMVASARQAPDKQQPLHRPHSQLDTRHCTRRSNASSMLGFIAKLEKNTQSLFWPSSPLPKRFWHNGTLLWQKRTAKFIAIERDTKTIWATNTRRPNSRHAFSCGHRQRCRSNPSPGEAFNSIEFLALFSSLLFSLSIGKMSRRKERQWKKGEHCQKLSTAKVSQGSTEHLNFNASVEWMCRVE